WAISRSQHRATVVEVAARQRTLAERYVKEVLLVREGVQADPTYTAGILSRSANALLDGGLAPPVNGDDDGTMLSPDTGWPLRDQLEQERRLVTDLTATGAALLAHRPVSTVPMTAHEHVTVTNPVERLGVLAALTSNVSLNAARTIAHQTDANISHLVIFQVVLGAIGLLMSLLFALALIAATRRQTAHFRSIVTSSTDLVLVLGEGGCRYVSQSVTGMVGRAESDLLGDGLAQFVHPEDRSVLTVTDHRDRRDKVLFRMVNRYGEWRFLEAHVTDLRSDRRIRGVVLNARDTTDRVRLEEELTHQAYHDGLTGLPNRALFRDRLDHALARSSRSGEVLAVLLVDLDGFKQVNDSLGHDAGDELLRQVAERFAETVRPADVVARFGGDEFGLLLDGAGESRAVRVAHRLLERLGEPVRVAGRELALGGSVGIVVHQGAGDSDELIRNADVAMYAAKEGGRGRCELFRDGMAREFGELLGLEHELRMALQRSEFSVHYQPEVDLGSGHIVGVEALLRWHSPSLGAVPAEHFIPIAEATGLIAPLGELVLHEACAVTATWRDAGLLPESFVTWVNLSGRQLSSGGVGALVRQALKEAGLPPACLGLEVTETAIVQGGAAGDRARGELERLHTWGVRLAIDDFGTGFSSLGQLSHFPVDLIKIERTFVQGVERRGKDAAITANVIRLAHDLGLLAVAEGVESESQRSAMRELGCDLAQGTLFARPMPPERIASLLAERRDSADFRAA
ncbi:MAG: putative bifunctional diguanylate cyclase/phosphodiesterase, partial [Gaiellales bacterium]